MRGCRISAAHRCVAALERAGQLISDNYANVAIQDGKGNEISGDDLIACYLGVMKLTPDLRAIAT
jgi:hypothetical protein